MLISADFECCLCGNFLEIGKISQMILLPCVDKECDACARMWRILGSPTCPACYAGFTCPRLVRDRAEKIPPQLALDANKTPKQPSPWDSQAEPSISLQERYVAFYGADADSTENNVSDPGSPMRDEEDGVLADEAFREALILANNRVGTNFNIEEIEDEIPLAVLRTGTKYQLADIVTQLCIEKAFESNANDGIDEGSQQLDERDSSDATLQQDGEITQENETRCVHCPMSFGNHGDLKQHMVHHTTDRRTCSVCGQVLANAASRRAHEKKHWETESQRAERLQKVRMDRNQLRARQGERKKRRRGSKRERVRRVLR